MEKFLSSHLGGRYQESMTPEVRAQLKKLTVDPKTIERPKPITTSSGAPTPASSLEPGTAAYQMRIEMAGQKMDMAATTEIKDEGTAWVITEIAKGPMGEMIDRTTLDKKSLVVRKRSISQGTMMSIDLEMKDGKATGEMKTSGQSRPISSDLPGDLFADGAGSGDVIATLPLAEGYSTTFRNLDAQTLQAKAAALFKQAFSNGSGFAKRLEEKIEEDFQRFVENGIHWEKRKPGFKK